MNRCQKGTKGKKVIVKTQRRTYVQRMDWSSRSERKRQRKKSWHHRQNTQVTPSNNRTCDCLTVSAVCEPCWAEMIGWWIHRWRASISSYSNVKVCFLCFHHFEFKIFVFLPEGQRGTLGSFILELTHRLTFNKCNCGTLHHAPVGRVCDGVDVRGHLVSLLALVHVHYVLGVDRQVLVRVDHHTEETRIRLGKTEDSGGQRGVLTQPTTSINICP